MDGGVADVLSGCRRWSQDPALWRMSTVPQSSIVHSEATQVPCSCLAGKMLMIPAGAVCSINHSPAGNGPQLKVKLATFSKIIENHAAYFNRNSSFLPLCSTEKEVRVPL